MAACAICGGSREEHRPETTRHAYTEVPGDLRPPDKPQPTQQVQPSLLAPQLARLCQLLVNKGLLTREDLIYIGTGVMVDGS